MKPTFMCLIILSIVFVNSILCGCGNGEVRQKDPVQELNSILNMAEATSVTLSQTGVFLNVLEDTAIVMNTIKEGVKLKFNMYGKIALTERCINQKLDSPNDPPYTLKNFAYDSSYVALINTRFNEIEKQLVDDGDPTYLDLWTRNEKLRMLIGKLNTICPTSDSTLMQ